MTITREEMIKRLSDKTGYYQKDIRVLLQAMDEEVFDALCEVTAEDEISVQLMTGIKIQCTPVEERFRKDPRDQRDIVCEPTCRVKAKISNDFKLKIQENYKTKNG